MKTINNNSSRIHPTASSLTLNLRRIGLTLALTSAMTFVLSSRAAAKDVKIDWQQTGVAVGTGYLPRVASDGGNGTDGTVDTVSIYQTTTGFAEFNYQTGFFSGGVNWNSPTSIHSEIGHEASIAMASYCIDSQCIQSGDAAIEVHQGGQDNGSLLWYRIGQGNVINVEESSTGIVWANRGATYDHGYNPTVAVDYSGLLFPPTLVEVHQAGVNFSELWFHYGTYNIGTSSSVTWEPAGDTGFQGYSPTVSVSDGLAVMVAQGSGGTLWYSLGAVNRSNGTIAWGPQNTYANGYNPTISLYETGNTFNGDWDVVEAHQANKGTGQLFYRTGHMSITKSGLPTSIKWTTEGGNTEYATGCYPSVTLFRISGVGAPYVVETHSADCGESSDIVSALGIFAFD
jgi:hypothetical protein